MGGSSSKNSKRTHVSGNLYAQSHFTNSKGFHDPPPKLDAIFPEMDKQSELSEPLENHSQFPKQSPENFTSDDFYDGIPRYSSLRSRSSRSGQFAKVSEVGSRLGRVGSAGLGKAVEVLDTLGSSMTNLNSSNGFASTVSTKGNELGILSFEVANTIVKGNNLMKSLSARSIRQLKEVVLPSKGVQTLVSDDMEELLNIFAADKREELKVFMGEVVRFGNRCKDSQWHSLDRYFDKTSRAPTPQRQSNEEAESLMELLMTLVQHTADLYHGLQVLDRIEQGYQCKHQEKDNAAANQKGDSISKLRTELKKQKKLVHNLKKKSLWSRSLEEVMEKLVDIVHFLLLEMHDIFGRADVDIVKNVSAKNHERLGPAGLSLHYANVVLQIDTLVARSSAMPPGGRDSLYLNLPPNIKSSLRSKLQSFHVKDELTVTEIKDEMEKTLQWLVPMCISTAKAHHGFGWVGEWANTGAESNRRPTSAAADIIQIDTLHHANKERSEAYILELVLWLHHLANKSKNVATDASKKLPTTEKKLPDEAPNGELTDPTSSMEEQVVSKPTSEKKQQPGASGSQHLDSVVQQVPELTVK